MAFDNIYHGGSQFHFDVYYEASQKMVLGNRYTHMMIALVLSVPISQNLQEGDAETGCGPSLQVLAPSIIDVTLTSQEMTHTCGIKWVVFDIYVKGPMLGEGLEIYVILPPLLLLYFPIVKSTNEQDQHIVPFW